MEAPMKNSKIKDIYEAASRFFISPGYAGTKIAHIAKEIGISVGTVYTYFKGKEEILYFILKCTIDSDYIERDFELPITNTLFLNIETELIEALSEIGDEFAENLNNESYTFENMISDAFDVVSRYAVGCLFIENNQEVIPPLTEKYRLYRKYFFETVQKYILKFIENGVIRDVEYPEYTVTLIVEMICTFGMDIQYNNFEKIDMKQDIAKKVCLDNIINAYKI